jgi:hypothetical protein
VAEEIVAHLPVRDRALADLGQFLRREDLARPVRFEGEELRQADRDRSRMRLRAPTDGLVELDSMREIVEFVTPAFLASSRWERFWAMRKKRCLPPISTVTA